MGPLAVNCLEQELEPTADYCRSEGLGLEVTALAYPEHLEDGLNARIDRHLSATQGVKPLSSHGPFFDLFAASRDPSISGVCRSRHLTAIQAGQAIGASIYVAHVGSGLAHCHLHDNDGRYDQHQPVGRGIEDWSELANSLERSAPQAVFVVESNSLERHRESVSAVRSRFF